MLAAALLVVLGFAGLLAPLLPGAPLLFLGFLLAAWAEDFAYVSVGTLSLLGVLALLTYVADLLAGALGAQRFGASPRAVAGAAIGAIAGLALGLVGVVIGPFVGAALGELTGRRSLEEAGRSGIGATIGLLIGVVAKLALGFAMLGVYAAVRFF